jgi:hypothetical protein
VAFAVVDVAICDREQRFVRVASRPISEDWESRKLAPLAISTSTTQ